MQVFTDFQDLNKKELGECVVTIGNFDGVHLGHQRVIKHAVELAQERHSHSLVLTFSNHPSEILRPHATVPRICTTSHKLALLEALGIDLMLLLEFTLPFSHQTAEDFLGKIFKHCNLSHLIVGHDATIGKNREGNKSRVEEYAMRHNFEVEYMDAFALDDHPVSSSRIRKLIQHGHLQEAERLLGRPYSVLAQVIPGQSKGKSLGFPTANMQVEGLCLPPHGVYAMQVSHAGKQYPAVANLGLAPTIRSDNRSVLEVHIPNETLDLVGKEIEATFVKFIRPEKKFNSLEELKAQIASDVQECRRIFHH